MTIEDKEYYKGLEYRIEELKKKLSDYRESFDNRCIDIEIILGVNSKGEMDRTKPFKERIEKLEKNKSAQFQTNINLTNKVLEIEKEISELKDKLEGKDGDLTPDERDITSAKAKRYLILDGEKSAISGGVRTTTEGGASDSKPSKHDFNCHFVCKKCKGIFKDVYNKPCEKEPTDEPKWFKIGSVIFCENRKCKIILEADLDKWRDNIIGGYSFLESEEMLEEMEKYLGKEEDDNEL